MKKIILIIYLFFISISVTNAAACKVVTGDGTNIGDEIQCGTENFYVISNDGANIKMLAKYNLYVGNTYYRINFDSTLTNYRDIYGVKEVQEKISEGYEIYKEIDDYDSETHTSTYHGVIMYKSYDWENTNPTIFFDTSISTIDEVLHRNDVKKYLNEGYNYNTHMLSDQTYIGITFSKSSNYEYKVIVFDEPKTLLEAANDSEVSSLFAEGYTYYSKVASVDGDYIAIILSKNIKKSETYEYITISLSSSVTSQEKLINSAAVKAKIEEGYAFSSAIYESKNFVAATLYKREGYEYKTYFINKIKTNTFNDKEIYLLSSVVELLNDGYKLETKYRNSNACYIYNDFCEFEYYALLFSKSEDYEYINIMFDDEVNSNDLSDYIASNEIIQNKISTGYTINQYYTITRHTTNSINSSQYTTYAGVGLNLYIGENNTNDKVEEKNNKTEVRQDKNAIGAHGDEKGNPEPEEIGIVDYSALWWDSSITYQNYSSGFSDYSYSANSDALFYFDLYYEALKKAGYDIQSVDSITVSEINELVYKISGEYLPLEDWYNNMSEISYDSIMNSDFYILGSLKKYLSSEYSWLWATTYWTRTSTPGLDYLYFIDTLGDLCAQKFCASAVGAGLRPVVTIAIDNIVFRIDTKTDGNGTIQTTHVEAEEGTEVQFTVTPNKGYVLGKVVVTDNNGNTITFIDYTFTMPNSNVTIEVTFLPENPETYTFIGIIFFVILGGSIALFLYSKTKVKKINE